MKTTPRDIIADISINLSPDQILKEKKEPTKKELARWEKLIELVETFDNAKSRRIKGKLALLTAMTATAATWFCLGRHQISIAVLILSTTFIFGLMIYWYKTSSIRLQRHIAALGFHYAVGTPAERAHLLTYARHMVEGLQKEQAGLTLESTVPPLYFKTIERIRKDIIGPDSKLLKAKQQLEDRARDLFTQAKEIWQRLQSAREQKDSKRIPMLHSAFKKAQARTDAVRGTCNDTVELINNIDGALKSCVKRVCHFAHQLGDVDLIRKIEGREDTDAELLAETRLAMEDAATEIGKQICSLHEKIATMASDPELGGKDEALDEYLDRIEEVNKEIAGIMLPKLLTA